MAIVEVGGENLTHIEKAERYNPLFNIILISCFAVGAVTLIPTIPLAIIFLKTQRYIDESSHLVPQAGEVISDEEFREIKAKLAAYKKELSDIPLFDEAANHEKTLLGTSLLEHTLKLDDEEFAIGLKVLLKHRVLDAEEVGKVTNRIADIYGNILRKMVYEDFLGCMKRNKEPLQVHSR